ncbi:hypothetical protein EJ07DRAFT_183199 [Lizonia empirigonia]|nr:hypothetical protein EJ07DRAFT_183199 [Lizonia empirigonia]
MKFLGTIVAAAALLASGISASPLGDLGGIHARALTDYDINTAIQKWMADPKTRKRLTNNCNTKGGWEGWAQAELEDEFKDEFKLSDSLREVSKVYIKGKLADLVLPKTAQKKGMIIELKCENAFGQKGVKILDPVNADVYKKSNVRPEYNDYTFVALAMAFTSDADKSLRSIGMKPIAKAAVAPPNTMQTYREDFKLDGLSNDMEDLNKALNNLFISKSRPSSPTSPPPSPKGKPAPGKGKKPV